MTTKNINFSVDSIETDPIKVRMWTSLLLCGEGSENSNKIKELTLKQIAFKKRWTICWLLPVTGLGTMCSKIVGTLLKNYKEDVKVNYIFAAPKRLRLTLPVPEAQYYLIFDPLNNKADVKCFDAVATSRKTRSLMRYVPKTFIIL
jgi:hypothetical protein